MGTTKCIFVEISAEPKQVSNYQRCCSDGRSQSFDPRMKIQRFSTYDTSSGNSISLRIILLANEFKTSIYRFCEGWTIEKKWAKFVKNAVDWSDRRRSNWSFGAEVQLEFKSVISEVIQDRIYQAFVYKTIGKNSNMPLGIPFSWIIAVHFGLAELLK